MKSIQTKCFFVFVCLALFNANAVRAEQTDDNISSLFYTLESKLNRSFDIGARFQNTFRLCQSADGYYGIVQNDENGIPDCFSLNHEGFVVSGNNNKTFKILTQNEILKQKVFERLSALSSSAGSELSWGKKGFYYGKASQADRSIFILTQPAPNKRSANDSNQDRNITLDGYDDGECANCCTQYYEAEEVQFVAILGEGVGIVGGGAAPLLGLVVGTYYLGSWLCKLRRRGYAPVD